MITDTHFLRREEEIKAKIVLEALLVTFGNAPASGGFAGKWERPLPFKLKFLAVT